MEANCFCLECKSPWRERFSRSILLHLHQVPQSFRSDHPRAHLQWHHPLRISQQQQQISFSTPSVTKLLHSHSVLSLINQPGQHPHIPVALGKGIYHSAVDQIWHTPSCAGNSQGGYTHTVDLLAWYTGQSKIKYVPQDISHLSWSCHKPIFTARTSRNWKRENTVASWPSKQSTALKATPHSSKQISWNTENAEMSPFFSLNRAAVMMSNRALGAEVGPRPPGCSAATCPR